MSSEDNSNRANSGKAFEGDSQSSSSPFGRQTPNFSWTDSLRRESTSRHANDVKGSSRLARGQDDAKATSFGRVEVSCMDDILSITIEDARRLAARYRLEVQMPSEQCRVHLPPRG